MGRKKAESIRKPFSDVYTVAVCDPLDKVGSPIFPRKIASRPHVAFAYEVSRSWFITACWLAYEIQPLPDIFRPPYTQPEFKAFKMWAKFLYAHLRLCKVCWENHPETRRQYREQGIASSWDWWVLCCEEIKFMWVNGDVEPFKTKAIFIKTAFGALGELENKKIPVFLNHSEMVNNHKLARVAQELNVT